MQQKTINYNDSYRSGYIYFYDNNKILTTQPDTVNISSHSCLKVFPGFIWHEQVDFTSKIHTQGSFTYVLPEFGDYLIINLRTGKYAGIIDKQYYNLYNRTTQQFYYPVGGMYDYDLKIERYTGGMLDGYLYFFESSMVPKTIVQQASNGNIDDYIFKHQLDIFEIPYIQETDKRAHGSSTINVPAKKVRVSYSDALLFDENEDGLYGFDKVLPHNSVAYENEDSFEINIVADNDNQTAFKWRGKEYQPNISIFDVWVNNERQPRDQFTPSGKTVVLNTIRKTRLYAKIYINGILEPLQEYVLNNNSIQLLKDVLPTDVIDIEINNIIQPVGSYTVTNDIVTFVNPIFIKQGDIISIKIRSQQGINQYYKYNLLKV